MKREYILSICFFVCACCVLAQVKPYESVSKMDAGLRHFVEESCRKAVSGKAASRSLSSVTAGREVNIVFYCDDQASVLSRLKSMNIACKVITSTVLTAYVPVDRIEELSALSGVRRIAGVRQKKLLNNVARAASGVDNVHGGVDLDTPYTGKGVIIGIVDCGIEYDHIAFRESQDSTRIIAAWTLDGKPTSPVYGSANIIAEKSDGADEDHGTHVSGIAAGGKTLGSAVYYGMAPDAEIVAAGCPDMSDANLLNGIALVRDVAEARGLPWVANMSLGSNIHPHDGSDEFALTLDTMVLGGGHIVAAAGNEGRDYLHASHAFASDGEKAFFIVNHDTGGEETCLDFVAEGNEDYEITPYRYDCLTKELTLISELNWKRSGSEIVSFHNKLTKRYEKQVSLVLSGGRVDLLDDYTTGKQLLALCVTGKKGQTVHGWVEPGEFYRQDADHVMPDREYQVNSPAIGREIIGVGSYMSSNKFTTYDNRTMSTAGTPGELSYFSSAGPSLDGLKKPEVCAPGNILVSAYNGRRKGFELDHYVSEIVPFNGTNYYYGAMSGTSMATPVVTGIVALWLEADPGLTHAQVARILQMTSKPFSGQVSGEWDYRYGYGKIQAYEGLKEVLKMTSGISTVRNTDSPVTILKESSQWRILFNSSESYARIHIYTADGRQIYEKHLSQPQRGQEETLSLSFLRQGLYVIRIQTRNSIVSRKILI